MRIEQNQFRRIFTDDRLNLPALEPENVLLETLTVIQPDKLLGGFDRRPTCVPQSRYDLGGRHERNVN
jgi:hypothetical protein